MKAYDVQSAARRLRENSRGRKLASFNDYTVGVARFSAHPLWERHPAGDEFLQVFDGELDITILADSGPIETTLRPGSVLVVPKGVWHSPRPRGPVTLLYVSDTKGSQISNQQQPPNIKLTHGPSGQRRKP